MKYSILVATLLLLMTSADVLSQTLTTINDDTDLLAAEWIRSSRLAWEAHKQRNFEDPLLKNIPSNFVYMGNGKIIRKQEYLRRIELAVIAKYELTNYEVVFRSPTEATITNRVLYELIVSKTKRKTFSSFTRSTLKKIDGKWVMQKYEMFPAR